MAVTINGSTGIELTDSDKQLFGTGDDLEIYHNGSHSYIKNTGTGNLYIEDAGTIRINTDSFAVQKNDGSESILSCTADGAVELYHNNVKKLWTETWGINIDGNLALGDSEELIFGGSYDMKIYHNGSLSFIQNGTGNLYIWSADGHDGHIVIQATYGEESIVCEDNGAVKLYHNNSLKFSTVAAGAQAIDDLLVGTSTFGGHGFSVSPDHSAGTAYAVWNRTASATTAYVASFQNNGSEVGKILHDDTTTTFGTSSDYRLKENQVAISDGITRLKTLKPYRFNFKCKPSKTVDGFFAHEVTAVPEAFTGTKDEVDSDGKPIYQAIDQSKLVPLLTAALQEAITKIETLETKVAALEAS